MGLEDDTEISWVENLHIYAIPLCACTMIQDGNLLRILKMGIPPFNHFTPQSLGYIIIIRAPSYVFLEHDRYTESQPHLTLSTLGKNLIPSHSKVKST